MFYDNIEKLQKIEDKVSDNLSTADCLNDSNDSKQLKQFWLNYRSDMPTMLGILREYKELIGKVKNDLITVDTPSGKRNFEILSSDFERIPQAVKQLSIDKQKEVLQLIEKIEDDEDVQNVYHSMKIKN